MKKLFIDVAFFSQKRYQLEEIFGELDVKGFDVIYLYSSMYWKRDERMPKEIKSVLFFVKNKLKEIGELTEGKIKTLGGYNPKDLIKQKAESGDTFYLVNSSAYTLYKMWMIEWDVAKFKSFNFIVAGKTCVFDKKIIYLDVFFGRSSNKTIKERLEAIIERLPEKDNIQLFLRNYLLLDFKNTTDRGVSSVLEEKNVLYKIDGSEPTVDELSKITGKRTNIYRKSGFKDKFTEITTNSDCLFKCISVEVESVSYLDIDKEAESGEKYYQKKEELLNLFNAASSVETQKERKALYKITVID